MAGCCACTGARQGVSGDGAAGWRQQPAAAEGGLSPLLVDGNKDRGDAQRAHVCMLRVNLDGKVASTSCGSKAGRQMCLIIINTTRSTGRRAVHGTELRGASGVAR